MYKILKIESIIARFGRRVKTETGTIESKRKVFKSAQRQLTGLATCDRLAFVHITFATFHDTRLR
jgi:hypothetical protein